MATPTDPLFASQWHFALIGDIETIWDDYTGSGVKVGIFDDGIQYTHADLDGNYDGSLSVLDGSGIAVDAFPNLTNNDRHGTAVAGIIAAENNGTGSVGIAYGASITGVNILDAATYGYLHAPSSGNFLNVVDQASGFDITANSWDMGALFQGQTGVGSFTGLYLQKVAQNLSTGRGGLGTVVVQAAGDDAVDANGSGIHASRYTLTVGASDAGGNVQSNSNFGASILITAPAASVTTDLLGEDGYNKIGTGELSGATPMPDALADTDYTSVFGGTAAAMSVVSGVVSLMQQANTGLGWRDVQNILAVSASHTGSAIGAVSAGFEQGNWQVNGARNWNGGGMSFHGSYGYGMVDAFAAVRMAEAWSVLNGAALTSGNELSGVSAITDLGAGLAIPANGTEASFSITSSVNLSIEHIRLNLNFAHEFIGDLKVFLTDPGGTKMQVIFNSDVPTDFSGTWQYGIENFKGVSSVGNWTVSVADAFAASDEGTVFSGSLEFFGSNISNDDVFHFTDDYIAYRADDASRAILLDTNGGVDWLNFAAISGGIDIDMSAGGGFSVGGVAWGSLGMSQTVFENLYAGDGNDRITGNMLANHLIGARGNDTLTGGVGNDILSGGAGLDTAVFSGQVSAFGLVDAGNGAIAITDLTGTDGSDLASGVETLQFSDGNLSVVTGSNTANTLVGAVGDDVLFGQSGNDYLLDLTGGNDILLGGDGDDQLQGSQGADRNIGGNGTDQVRYNNSDAPININLATGIATGGHAEGDTFDSIEGVVGSNFNDTLIGDNGANRLEGFLGDDTLIGGLGGDVLFGDLGFDFVDYSASTQAIDVGVFRVGTGGTADGDTLLSVEAIIGSDFDDVLIGGGFFPVIRLDGGKGNDFLFDYGGKGILNGGPGNDMMIGSLGADDFDGGTGIDTVRFANAIGAVNVNLALGVGLGADAQGDTFVNVENLTGSIFFDTLVGDNGVNHIKGLAGRDRITGGGGNDQLYGGADLDTFIYDTLDWGIDIIYDFDPAREFLDFSATGLEFSDFSIVDTAFGLRIDYIDPTNGFQAISLASVEVAALGADDFIF